MTRNRGSTATRLQFLCLLYLSLILIFICGATAEHNHHGSHQHLHHGRRHSASQQVTETPGASPQPSSGSASALTSVQEANELIQRALKTLSVVNKLRLDNAQCNNYEFRTSESGAGPAPDLDVDAPVEELSKRTLHKRDRNDTDSQLGNFAYSIPEELRRAARIVAESATPETPKGDHESIAAQFRRKYALPNNDTNAPRQKLKVPDGLFEYAPGWEERGYADAKSRNQTGGGGGLEARGNSRTDTSTTANTNAKRQDSQSSFWMASMPQRGTSPFAPNGYKVWRNVKDYGAKGDGVTDDTEAINLAISDGGRCGANCGSSTIYPAVVYFPAGTYLVSSSIIQYYNTQFLGDPHEVPTILAAASFVGLGVITSDVYVSDDEQWYINQNNFLRNVRNFKIDIRLTDPNAYVCAIHWQVAQGTSLENIEFYMLADTTQQGIYMENGSGGFLADLTFVGGNFGAYFGNQQFTSSHLIFVNCNTALQIHWDWAWTMQDIIIESCQQGIAIVGGAGGPASNGQPVGSLLLTDSLIANTPTGIITSLYAENSTSFLVQNTGFFNVQDAIIDDVLSRTLVEGGNEVFLENWGFGMISMTSGTSEFVNGQNIPAMNRSTPLLSSTGHVGPNYFTRRRPKYHDIGYSMIVDVKTMGAKGDGVTDDTPVLNIILQNAANMSSIVYFPHGIYIIKDTLKVPVGSRIIGQAWSQIMATGPKFEDELHPKVAIRVGEAGEVGVIEIQDMLFTVSGNTAGVILMEWNVHESVQGSAGIWDSHFRVGGAIGSSLQKDDCPKKSGPVNSDCVGASLLLHLTPTSSAYMENIWVWVADHDLDVITQDQVDIYVGRGVLIESQGPTWLYGTTSEHCVLYQYQLFGARDVLLGMIQTESPYYQPIPPAPGPFTSGLFPGDPTFDDCAGSSKTVCALSWAVRVINSESVYLLGAGLYSFFNDYSQTCLGTEDCQQKGFEIAQSNDIWIYNLCTKAMIEMVSPVGELATLASSNRNGFLSSILAWVRVSSDTIIGERDFPGFQLQPPSSSFSQNLTSTCATAMAQTVYCHDMLAKWQTPSYHGSLGDRNLTDAVCDLGCKQSLENWFKAVDVACTGQNITTPGGANSLPTKTGATIWAAYNETCVKDETSDMYCDEIIDQFTLVDTYQEMPEAELCSYCYVEKHRIMQSSPYSFYHRTPFYKSRLEYIYATCPGVSGPTEFLPLPVASPPEEPRMCFTDSTYVTKEGDTCDSIAQESSVSSAYLQMANTNFLYNCTNVPANKELCLPLTCGTLYILQPNDTCLSIELDQDLALGDVRKYNSWIDYWCDNLQTTTWTHGHTLCLSPQGGIFNATDPIPGVIIAPGPSTGYTGRVIPALAEATVAEGTTPYCGRWHEVANEDETCVEVCTRNGITIDLFRAVNPSIAGDGVDSCSGLLMAGITYCVGPIYGWDSIEAGDE